MPTRIVLEGPRLEPLLAQVRDEYGGSARIVSANKVRSGGLVGFFAKQRFELSVELGDEPTAEAAVPGEVPGSTLLDLVDAGESRFERTRPPAVPPAVVPVRSAGTASSVPLRASVMSTSGSAFAEVMAGLQTDLASAPRTEPPATDTRQPATDERRLSDPAQVLAHDKRRLADPAQVLAHDGARQFESEPNGARPAPPTLAGHPLAADLAALGLPTHLAIRARGEEPYQAVLSALAGLRTPPAPPDRPGDILVIIGELTPALHIAEWATRTLRLDPEQVLLAGSSTAGTSIDPTRRISGPADAERRARRMHRADVPYVVVVDAPLGVDAGWTEAVCEALVATAVWATVDATRKPGDTANHLRSMGKVDALAVYAADICADPGTVLALPAPVALLDGAVASTHEWAALLSRRLTAQRAAPAGRTGRETGWR